MLVMIAHIAKSKKALDNPGQCGKIVVEQAQRERQA
jgi:hypothetical protein